MTGTAPLRHARLLARAPPRRRLLEHPRRLSGRQIAALDVAEAGGPIGDRAADLLGRRVLADFGGGATFEAEVVGATPHAVALRGRHDGRPRDRDARYGHPYRVGGGTGVEDDLLLCADPSLTALTPID